MPRMEFDANTQTYTIARHYDPGTWSHPRAREMGLSPNVHLTVEIVSSAAGIWERIKANNLEIYFMPIVEPLNKWDDDENE